MKLEQIPLFEKQNPDISVNVISLDSTKNSFFIDYLSPEKTRRHKVNLLLLSDENTQHYVYIKKIFLVCWARGPSMIPRHTSATVVCMSFPVNRRMIII